jgi:hypothetical protein
MKLYRTRGKIIFEKVYYKSLIKIVKISNIGSINKYNIKIKFKLDGNFFIKNYYNTNLNTFIQKIHKYALENKENNVIINKLFLYVIISKAS